jgi:predicted GIY-YIG superfamily endonuclease
MAKQKAHWEKIDEPHAVYRFWHKNTLLYVGCSFRFPERMMHHSSTKGWYREIDRITIEWFPDFLSGRRAETKAIELEKPKYNVRF